MIADADCKAARKVQTKKDPLTDWSAGLVAAVLGFEPKITESESVVLPLHYTATNK